MANYGKNVTHSLTWLKNGKDIAQSYKWLKKEKKWRTRKIG